MALAECSEDCNRLVFEAVDEISVSKFQLVKRTYRQIQVLTGLVQCNEKGETPLVIAIKGENVSLIDELVMFLLACDREVVKCHEMSLIVIDQLFHHQIPIMELIEHLTKEFPCKNLCADHSKWLDILAQVVFKSTSSRQDKIIALELIGASQHKYYEEDSESVLLTFRCWREAMTLRYFPADGEPLLPKMPYVGVSSVASSVVFGSAVEVLSMEGLDLLEGHFERNVDDPDVEVQLIDLMQRQSLLVIRRISSQANHGHPYWFYLQSLYEYGRGKIEYSDDGDVNYSVNNKVVVTTFLLILEQITGYDPKLLPRKLFDMFFDTLAVATQYLAFMARESSGNPNMAVLSYDNLLALTKFIGTIAKCFPNPAIMSLSCITCFNDSFAMTICELIFVLDFISPHLNNQEQQELEEYLSIYLKTFFLERRTTVLHLAVVEEDLKRLKLNKLILQLGADPNAIDETGKTPLHILAATEEVYLDDNLHIFQALVDAGAHLDMAADNGDTVLEILKRNLEMHGDRGVAANTYFSSLINTSIFPLSCYCARVIRRHEIQFDEDRLPFHLQEFVSCHSAKGSIDLH